MAAHHRSDHRRYSLLREDRRLGDGEIEAWQLFGRKQAERLGETKRINRRIMEVGACGRAARRREHARVFGNWNVLRELLAAVKKVRPHLEDEVSENGAARIEERLDDDLRAVGEDH